MSLIPMKIHTATISVILKCMEMSYEDNLNKSAFITKYQFIDAEKLRNLTPLAAT